MKRLLNLPIAVLSIFILLNLILAIILAPTTVYAARNTLVDNNMLYFFFGIALLFIKWKIIDLLYRKYLYKYEFNKVIRLTTFIMFFIISYFTYSYYYYPRYDAGTLLLEAFDYVNTGGEGILKYLSTYPNNRFLFALEVILAKIILAVGQGFESYHLASVLISLLIYVYSINLVANILKKLNISTVVIYYIVYVYLIGIVLLPWTYVFYSDVLLLLITLLIINIYLSNKSIEKKIFFIILFSLFAYSIKPTSLGLIFGIIVWNVFNIKETIKKLNIKKFSIAIILASTVFMLLNTGIRSQVDIKFDKEKEFGFTHWLMLGVNKESGGSYSQGDYDLSYAAPSKEERYKVNIAVIKDRVGKMGVLGTADLFIKKTMSIYSDSTFSYNTDNPKDIPLFENKYLYNKYLNEVYMGLNKSSFYYSSFKQSIWLGILLLCSSLVLVYKKLKIRTKEILTIIAVLILMVSTFHIIFETRARYILFMTPLYFIISGIVVNELVNWRVTKKGRYYDKNRT